MQIAIISGSTRSGSESRNVSEYLRSELEEISADATIIDLNELKLPVFDATGEGEWKERVAGVKDELTKSDGAIFVSPEWDGMMSPGLHNFLHYLNQELADKPIYLVSVSAGRGGRYPLLNMRQMGYKNKHFVIIPESLIVDEVTDNLVAGDIRNEHIRERARYGLNTLLAYARALRDVRASGVTDYERFRNGW